MVVSYQYAALSVISFNGYRLSVVGYQLRGKLDILSLSLN